MTNKLFSSLGSLCFSLVALVAIPACAVADGEGDEDITETAGTTGGKLDQEKLDRAMEAEQPTPSDDDDRRRMDSDALATGLQLDSDAKFDERRPATDGVEVAGSDAVGQDDAMIDGSIDLADVLESLRLRNVR